MTRQTAPSYLATGASPEALASFFRATAELFRAAPWDALPEGTFVAAVTVEALGIRDRVLGLTGDGDRGPGWALFDSREGFETVLELANGGPEGEPTLPPHLVLSFERGAEISPQARREVAQHGWEVAGPPAYPSAWVVDGKGKYRPPSEDEFLLAEAISRLLVEAPAYREELERAWFGLRPFSRTFSVATHRGRMEVLVEVRDLFFAPDSLLLSDDFPVEISFDEEDDCPWCALAAHYERLRSKKKGAAKAKRKAARKARKQNRSR